MNWDGSDVEPRLLQPSFANTYFSALPLATLHTYRRLARSSHVSDVAMPARTHLNNLVQPRQFVVSRPKGGTGYTYG